jgi:hypothetical protein
VRYPPCETIAGLHPGALGPAGAAAGELEPARLPLSILTYEQTFSYDPAFSFPTPLPEVDRSAGASLTAQGSLPAPLDLSPGWLRCRGPRRHRGPAGRHWVSYNVISNALLPIPPFTANLDLPPGVATDRLT